MAYLLRALLSIMAVGLALVTLQAHGLLSFPLLGHIPLAIFTFLYTIFTQAFVMFYFIGTSRLVQNVCQALELELELELEKELENEGHGTSLRAAKRTAANLGHQATVGKRQTIPWSMLMLTLGSLAFLLGGAYDTGLVEKTTHSGVAYGFFAAMVIGCVRQWHFLGKNHLLLRKLKGLFGIPDGSM